MDNDTNDTNWCETATLLPFSTPTTILICGSTQSGKTYFTKLLLQNAKGMFTKPVQKIIYAYSEYQNIFDDMKTTNPGIIFHQGLPSKEDIDQYTEDMICTSTKSVVTVSNPNKICRDSRKRKLYNQCEDKKYQMVYTKRRIF